MSESLIKKIVSFAKAEDGIAVEWPVVIIIGIIIAVGVFVAIKNAPKGIGEGIENAGDNAKEGLDSIRY